MNSLKSVDSRTLEIWTAFFNSFFLSEIIQKSVRFFVMENDKKQPKSSGCVCQSESGDAGLFRSDPNMSIAVWNQSLQGPRAADRNDLLN